jgi:hypothetical protein
VRSDGKRRAGWLIGEDSADGKRRYYWSNLGPNWPSRNKVLDVLAVA